MIYADKMNSSIFLFIVDKIVDNIVFMLIYAQEHENLRYANAHIFVNAEKTHICVIKKPIFVILQKWPYIGDIPICICEMSLPGYL